MFYGVKVLMYFFDNLRHKLPHIHIEYGDEAVIGIPSGDLIEGSLKRSQMRLVQAWIEIHQDELLQNWELAIDGKAVFKIEPLK